MTALSCALIPFLLFANNSKNARIDVSNSQQPAVVTRDLNGNSLDDGYVTVIPGWHGGDSLISSPEPDRIVGEIPYTANVSASGKVNMNIPIIDFASTYEYSPKLSLNYDGGSGFFDYLGYGWSLGGVPVIEKTVSDFFTDGNVDRYSSDSLAVLMLDGVRLIKQSDGSYLSQTGNTRAIKNTQTEFKVMYEDGSVATFSCEDDYDSTFDRLRYYIRKRKALDGQEITYNYRKNVSHNLFGNRMYIESITYGDGRQVKFRFNHKNRVDNGVNKNYTALKYVSGTPYTYYFKLDTIDVMYGSEVLTRYEILYKDQHIESPIASIRRLDGEGKSFHPLSLTYGTPDSIRNWQNKSYTLGSYINTNKLTNLNFRTGRFDNGSENEGLLMFPKKDAYTINDCENYVFNSHYSSTDTLVVSVAIPSEGTAIPCGKIALDDTFVEALAMDADGHNGDEVVVINEWSHPYGGNSLNSLYFKIYNRGNELSDKNYSMYCPRTFTIQCENQHLPKSFLSGDFDGDGREEILALSHQTNGAGATARLIDVGQGCLKDSFPIDSCHVVFPQNANINNTEREANYWSSDRLFTTDYNGDGKPELCVMNSKGLKFYSFRYSNDGSLVMDSHTTVPSSGDCLGILNTDSLRNFEIVPGDFNGDGCTDFVIPIAGYSITPTGWSGNSNISVAYSVMLGNGNGKFFAENGGLVNLGLMRDGIPDETLRQVQVADINRDGISDLVFEIQRGSTVHSCALTFRNGMGHYNTESITFNDSEMLIPAKAPNTSVMDNHSIMVLSTDGIVTFHKLSAPADVQRCLSAINDHHGNIRTFSYARTYRANNFPVDGATSFEPTFPYTSCADGRLVCIEEKQKADNKVVADVSYQYGYPVVHLQGLGFCGFREVVKDDCITGAMTHSTFSPEKLGTPTETQTYVDNQHQKTDTYDYELVTNSAKQIRSLIKSHTENNYVSGVINVESFGYDEFGNVTSDTIAYGNDGLLVKSFTYNNICANDLSLIGQVSTSVQTVTRGTSTLSSGESFSYDSNHLPSSNVKWTGENRLPVNTVSYTYDSKKRPTRVTTVPYCGSALRKTISYTGNSRNPGTIKDENGVTTAYNYGGYGVVRTIDQTSLTDGAPGGGIGGGEINPGIGLHSLPGASSGGTVAPGTGVSESPVTKYHYDSFGRVDSVTCAYGGGIKNTFEWAMESDSSNYVITVKEDGAPIKKTWYDSLNRKKREGVQRPDGTFLMKEYCYDNRGQLCAVSDPFKTSPVQWTRHAYDSSSRPICTSYPDGHSDIYQYSGLSTYSNVDGQVKTTTSDAMGFVTCITEGDGDGSHIEYSYRADGKPLQVTLGGAISTTFEYDEYGRQTAINDPSAGRRERTYDTSGRIASETDARGKSVTCTYDEKARPVRRVIDGGTTFDYTYDAHSNLLSMKTDGTVTRTYTYDDYSRLTSMTEGIFSKRISYSGNNVENIAYFVNNSQICNEQYSRALGTLTSVNIGGGTNVWRLLGENEKGLPTSIGLGSLSQQLSYDIAGRVTGRKVRYGSLPYIQNAAYEYDNETGNMILRSDSIFGHEEPFDYDYMNRLTSGGVDSYAYDTKGNVTRRDGVGAYTYTSTRPYSVSEVPFNTMIPQREQHISYNALQLPDSISEGGATATFTYGGDLQRRNMRITKGSSTLNVNYYDGTFNSFDHLQGEELKHKQVLYLAGDAYTAPAALVRGYNGGDSWQLRYILRDNQGSIIAITDTSGNVIERNDYDPWGVLRNPQTQIPYAPGDEPDLLLGRGYCGHEHLTDFGLINMNARLHDPAVARFLSPDPVVQAPDNSQSFNRYSYCLNNPLKYVDPSGLQFLYKKTEEGLFVEMDEVLVTAERIKWWEYYNDIILPQPRNVFSNRHPMVYAPNVEYVGEQPSSNTPNVVSIINTSLSFPINTTKQRWERILDAEAKQISSMQKEYNQTKSISRYKQLQSQLKQYETLSKTTRALEKLSTNLSAFGFGMTLYDVYNDYNNSNYNKCVGRVIVAGAAYGSTRIPYAGAIISVSIGLSEALWGEDLYNWMEDQNLIF